MSTSTLPARSTVFAQNLGGASRSYIGFSKGNPGSKALIIEGQPVFRSGTFRDSMGEESMWDKSHMDNMVMHFNMLSANRIAEDIPVRKYHPDRGGIFGGEPRNPMDELIGYVTNLRAEDRSNPVDGQQYTYLVADFEILDEVAIQKIQSGLWRNVSAEIGPTITNANAEYWPTFRGVAYVDFPAVEGLKMHAAAPGSVFRLITEDNMSGTTQAPGSGPALPTAGVTGGGALPTPPVPQAQPVQFKLGDQVVSDHAAVQSALDELVSLREFKAEQTKLLRTQFAQHLVDTNRYPVTQKEELTQYCLGLSDEHFMGFYKLMAATPDMSMLANHGVTADNGPQKYSAAANGEMDETQRKIALYRGQLTQHKLAGMPQAQIEKLGSYTSLKALDPTFNLSQL